MWSNYHNKIIHVIVIKIEHQIFWYLCISRAGTPAGVDYREVRESLLSIKGVKAVHNLHIWALTMNQAVLSAHVAIGEDLLVSFFDWM